MKYNVSIIECANDRLQVSLFNEETDEEIRIDETRKDVEMLCNVLSLYFEQKFREMHQKEEEK